MKHVALFLFGLFMSLPLSAQHFSEHFADSTLRLDYVFAGDVARQQIFVDELSVTPRWYGRRHRLSELPLKGNGQITVTAPATGDTLYRHSFSTLFQEWLATAEAKQVAKSFENVFLIPFPKHPVNVNVQLFDYHDQVVASLTHRVDPKDCLIRQYPQRTPYVTLQRAIPKTRWSNICRTVAMPMKHYSVMSLSVRCASGLTSLP